MPVRFLLSLTNKKQGTAKKKIHQKTSSSSITTAHVIVQNIIPDYLNLGQASAV